MTGSNPSIGRMRDELGVLRTELSNLSARVRTLRRRTEQLSALRAETPQWEARIAALEGLLDFDRVSAHARGAAERARLAASPVPHLVIAELFPRDVYRTLLDAIPMPVFFDGRATEGQQLGVPPRLAPAHAVVTWMFVNDVVRQSLSELLVARLAAPLTAYAHERFPSLPPLAEWAGEMTLIDGRIVRRTPGYAGPAPVDRPWELLTGVLDLVRDHDGEEYGSRLAGVSIPFRPNTALVCVGPPDRRSYAPIPPDAPAGVERHTYEFGIGPARSARRRLDTQGRVV